MKLKTHTIIKEKDLNFNIKRANKHFKDNDIKIKIGNRYKYLTLCRDEALLITILQDNDIKGNIIDEPYEQATKGDLTIISEDKKNLEVKTFYLWRGINSLSLDMQYYACDSEGTILYSNGKKVPFEQGYFHNNLGWVYNLKECDIIILINEELGTFYTLENFQEVRENLIDHYEKGTEPEGIKLGWTPDKKKKLTRVFHIHLDEIQYIEAIGGKITKYTFEIQ